MSWMLRCAKMRAGVAARHFMPSQWPDTKLTAKPRDARLFQPFGAFRVGAGRLYNADRRSVLRLVSCGMTTLKPVSLDDKYDLTQDRVFVTGYQALIRAVPDAEGARPPRRASIPRASSPAIAARRSAASTSNSSARRASSRRRRRQIPGRHQRRARRHRAMGHAAGRAARRRQVRWRVRHVVRQGPRRRPLRRRVPPRQHGRHLAAWRRARADGRRPHRRILDHRAPIRIPFRRRDDADPQSGRRAGDHRLRPLWLGDVALHRRPGRRSNACTTRWSRPPSSTARSTACKIVTPTDFAMPPGGLNDPPQRHHSRPGSAAARLQARRHARLHARQQAQQDHHDRAAARRRSASSPPASPISMCARRSTSSASTRSSATTSASACSRSAARGRSRAAIWSTSRRASISSSSSRKSAR